VIKLFFLGFLFCLTSQAGTILIDPGHGGEENGAVSTIDGTREKDLALELSMLIRNHLLSDYHVYLTRTGDQTLALDERSNTAQKIGADLFISVHLNSSESSMSNGFETFYLSNNLDEATKKVVRVENGEHSHPMEKSGELDALTGEILAEIVVSENIPESKKLGEMVHKSIGKRISRDFVIKDRGLKPGLFYVLAMTKIPGILLEVGFLSSKHDLGLVKSKKFLNSYARGVAEGIKAYFMNSKKGKSLLSVQ
jgi:N-acetylmuramoyl-L-alanine amidase